MPLQSDFPVVLDACVLAPPKVCDLFLRLAESPRLYLPKWSADILDEVWRTQTTKLRPAFPPELATYWRIQVESAFPEGNVIGYEHLMKDIHINEKDRHVMAAAIHSKASLILTFNLKDFPKMELTKWGLSVSHPQDYATTLFEMKPAIVVQKLNEMANASNISIEDLLIQLGKSLPLFSSTVWQELGNPS